MSRVFLLALAAPLLACSSEAPNLFFDERPLVIAHGGGQGLGPDHTLPTYRASLDAGADVLELDVHRSADGDLIVMHDDTVDRMTDGSGLIREMTTAEIQALDAGYRWTDDDGATYPFRGQGYTVPTVAEVFEAFPNAYYNIEIKQAVPRITDDVVALLDRFDLRERALVASFSDPTIQAFREAAPDVETSLAFEEGVQFGLPLLRGDTLPSFYEPPGRFLQTSWYVDVAGTEYEVLQEDLIAEAATHGIIVHAWTINDADEMDTLLARGVRGLITDFPGRARAAVDRR